MMSTLTRYLQSLTHPVIADRETIHFISSCSEWSQLIKVVAVRRMALAEYDVRYVERPEGRVGLIHHLGTILERGIVAQIRLELCLDWTHYIDVANETLDFPKRLILRAFAKLNKAILVV